MKVGDLVTMRYSDHRYEGAPKPKGIVVAVDPEGINDEEEVAVLWNDGDRCNHSTWVLELINESR